MPTLVIDDHIPFLKGVLEPFSRVIYAEGGRIGRDLALQADGLVIRTRTFCNEDLLRGTPVRFIATATIGHDHIDTIYCRENGISWAHAPGCNANSVRQYIASALVRLARMHNFDLAGKTIGIIGVGNVGRRVARLADLLGMKALLNDPPRARAESPGGFCSLEEICRSSDIITFHVPLTYGGEDRTFHLAANEFFDKLERKPFIINTSRGPVVDTPAIKAALAQGKIAGYAADVWENEPGCDRELLQLSAIATPHIAGYSVEGKANGTAACIRAASRFFGFGLDDWYPAVLPQPGNPLIEINAKGKTGEEIIAEAILASYDVMKDDASFRADPDRFEELRNFYPARREFEAFRMNLKNSNQLVLNKLKKLGFSV